MDNAFPIFKTPSADMSADALSSRLNNRAARFYWADDEPSPMRRSFSTKSSDSHFEESPLVIAAISAGVIGVAIIVIILVGIWIRSRLFTEVERRNSANPNNASVRSSMSTLDEESEAYVVCMEMEDGAVLGSMHNVADNYCANDVTIEIKPNGEISSKVNYVVVPETVSIAEKHEQSTCNDTDTKMTLEKTEETISENIRQSSILENGIESSTNHDKST